MKEIAKSLGIAAAALFAIVAILLISVLLIRGGVWLGAIIYPWLLVLNGITFAITVFVFLPNAIFSSTPRFAGTGMMVASFVFGLTLWVWSLLLTHALWGRARPLHRPFLGRCRRDSSRDARDIGQRNVV